MRHRVRSLERYPDVPKAVGEGLAQRVSIGLRRMPGRQFGKHGAGRRIRPFRGKPL